MASPHEPDLRDLLLTDPDRTLDELAADMGSTPEQLTQDLAELHREGLIGAPGTGAVQLTGLQDGWAAMIRSAEDHLAAETARVTRLRASLDHLIEQERARLDRTTFIVHTTLDTARQRLEDLSRSATTECLSLNPGPALPPDAVDAAKPLDQQALERGVQIRSIYQESFILDPDTMAFAQWFENLGGQIRTQPTVDRQLIIVDREVAFVVPTRKHRSDGLALEISNPTLVEVLTTMFDTMWNAARPYTARPQRNWSDINDPLAQTLLHLLADGATDEQAARKLGVSERTARRLMASLMQTLGATSRFQAGAEAVRQGLL